MKKTLPLILVFLSFIFSSMLYAQPAIQWQKSYGGTGNEGIQALQQTSDSGFIMVCYTSSGDSDVSGNYGGNDAWVVRTDAQGNILWRKCYGGTDYDLIIGMKGDAYGNFYLCGETNSSNGTVPAGNHGNGDAWVMKINDTGAILWQKVLGGSQWDFANAINTTKDKGCIMAGGTYSVDGDIPGLHGGGDVWVVKFDSTGNIQWNKTYGGNGEEWAFGIQQTFEGGYVFVASSSSLNGDVTGNIGDMDCWVVKLDDTGSISWQENYGGTGFDQAYVIHQNVDSGYTFLGAVQSSDVQVTGNHGGFDNWLVNINATGSLVWEKTFGGIADDMPTGLQATSDGGYVLAGFTGSNNGNVSGNHGQTDYWVIKTNDTGAISWQTCLGGTSYDSANTIIQTYDGGYAIGGGSTSNSGQVSGNHGGEDAWLVKLGATTGVPVLNNNKPEIKVYPTVSTGIVTIDLPPGFEQADIKLLTLSGKELKTSFGGSALKRILNMQKLATATYLLQVWNKGEVSSYRIVYLP